MVWNLLIPAATSVLGGIMGSRSQKSAQRQQQAAQQQALDQQERMMREAMAQQDRYYNQMLAMNYPRQRGSNSAFQQMTDLMGLGDIYAPPTEGSMGGGAAFYPGAPVSMQQGGQGGMGMNGMLANWQPNYTGNAGYDDYLRNRFNAYTRSRSGYRPGVV